MMEFFFCSPKYLDIMTKYEHWFANEMKCSPSIFWKIYTIYVLKQNTVISNCFDLLLNKTQANYIEVLYVLK